MNYNVKLHPKVNKFINKLEKNISIRIREKLKLLKINPFRYLEHYEGVDCFKYRIGNYRALVDVDKKEKIVFIRVFDHRKRVYKRN